MAVMSQKLISSYPLSVGLEGFLIGLREGTFPLPETSPDRLWWRYRGNSREVVLPSGAEGLFSRLSAKDDVFSLVHQARALKCLVPGRQVQYVAGWRLFIGSDQVFDARPHAWLSFQGQVLDLLTDRDCVSQIHRSFLPPSQCVLGRVPKPLCYVGSITDSKAAALTFAYWELKHAQEKAE